MTALRWNAKNGALSIPLHMLDALHRPTHLVAQREDDAVVVLYLPWDIRIRSESKVRKVNYPERAMPRISIGPDPAHELGLIDGRWKAELRSTCIVAMFDQ